MRVLVLAFLLISSYVASFAAALPQTCVPADLVCYGDSGYGDPSCAAPESYGWTAHGLTAALIVSGAGIDEWRQCGNYAANGGPYHAHGIEGGAGVLVAGVAVGWSQWTWPDGSGSCGMGVGVFTIVAARSVEVACVAGAPPEHVLP